MLRLKLNHVSKRGHWCSTYCFWCKLSGSIVTPCSTYVITGDIHIKQEPDALVFLEPLWSNNEHVPNNSSSALMLNLGGLLYWCLKSRGDIFRKRYFQIHFWKAFSLSKSRYNLVLRYKIENKSPSFVSNQYLNQWQYSSLSKIFVKSLDEFIKYR